MNHIHSSSDHPCWDTIFEACKEHMRALIDLHEAARGNSNLQKEVARGIRRLVEGLPPEKRESFLSNFTPPGVILERIFKLLRFQAAQPLRIVDTVETAQAVYRAAENIFLRRSS